MSANFKKLAVANSWNYGEIKLLDVELPGIIYTERASTQ